MKFCFLNSKIETGIWINGQVNAGFIESQIKANGGYV